MVFSYGDILPNTSLEKWLSTLFMLWGVILFGYILGELASMLTNADAQRARYIHRLNTIREHLNKSGISDSLKKKVVGYYEYLVRWSVDYNIVVFILMCCEISVEEEQGKRSNRVNG